MNQWLAFGGLAVVGLLSVAGYVAAHPTDTDRPGIDSSLRDAFREIMGSGDYETAKQFYEENGFPQMMEHMDEASFALMQEAHAAMAAGDFETAHEIRSQLRDALPEDLQHGTGFQKGFGRGFGHGFRKGMHECDASLPIPSEDATVEATG
ncbi:hypothetical protein KJ765_00435 [Candidatus Micrarchaeota archaeon]|nr:hypothetical protein [Candidatus Micrarchaeota archaeon]